MSNKILISCKNIATMYKNRTIRDKRYDEIRQNKLKLIIIST